MFMKFNKSVLLALSAMTVCALAGCGQKDTSPNWKSGDKVFTRRIVFDTSVENPETVHFYLGVNSAIKSVILDLDDVPYGYHGGVLSIPGTFLKEFGPFADEQGITVEFQDPDQEDVYIPVVLAEKFITTPKEFQDIQDHLTGIYALGSDIDFSNFGNFEPLGVYGNGDADPSNSYFHGVLEGNGFSLKNMTVSYSNGAVSTTSTSGYPSNKDVYDEQSTYKKPSHIHGNNFGVFQCIGSSGVVRNLTFDNVSVHGRCCVGVIAGLMLGTVNNCLVKQNCSALMDTHFWDDNLNVGGAFGTVGGSGKVNNVVSLTKNSTVRPTFEDYSDEYVGKESTTWDKYDHPSANLPYWRYWGADREDSNGQKITDSNNQQTNGTYSFVGKNWGLVSNCLGRAFKYSYNPDDQSQTRDVAFGQTNLAKNAKNPDEAVDMGEFVACSVKSDTELMNPSSYNSTFSSDVWTIVSGQYPSIRADVNHYDIAK